MAQGAPAPAPTGGGLQILNFKPAFDELMTLAAQLRHIKLYAAGQQKNRQLAAFELNEMRQSLRRIGQTIPNYRTYKADAAAAAPFHAQCRSNGCGDQSLRSREIHQRQ